MKLQSTPEQLEALAWKLTGQLLGQIEAMTLVVADLIAAHPRRAELEARLQQHLAQAQAQARPETERGAVVFARAQALSELANAVQHIDPTLRN